MPAAPHPRFRRAARFALAGVTLCAGACGSEAPDRLTAVKETGPSVEAAAPAPMRLPPGAWTGEGTFTLTWAGETATVRHVVNLVVGDDGIPKAMPGIGIVDPWAVYVADKDALELSPGATLESGGTVWAYCRAETGGTANEIKIEPRGHASDATGVEWRYHARYRFADLLHYRRYDYTEPGVPVVEVEARDRYDLDRSGSAELLRMSGRGEGVRHDTGERVALELEVPLVRGRSLTRDGCQLGPRSVAP